MTSRFTLFRGDAFRGREWRPAHFPEHQRDRIVANIAETPILEVRGVTLASRNLSDAFGASVSVSGFTRGAEQKKVGAVALN